MVPSLLIVIEGSVGYGWYGFAFASFREKTKTAANRRSVIKDAAGPRIRFLFIKSSPV
jgi:hypothetical protein